jgi:hypothetical protein
MTIEPLRAEALRLSPEGRAHLARELLSSLDELSEAEVEALWIEEALRRDDELDQGAEAHPADEVLAGAIILTLDDVAPGTSG